jgi:hypothetical protein
MTAAEAAQMEAAMSAAAEGGYGGLLGEGIAGGSNITGQGVNALELAQEGGAANQQLLKGLLEPADDVVKGSGTKSKALQMAMKSMNQPQQQPMSAPGRPMQAEQGPLNNPYSERAGPYGPGGNSLGLLNETEEERKKRLKRQRGLLA